MSESSNKVPAWLEQLKGKFVVFDGPDGSGKSTQYRLLCDLSHEAGLEVCEVREPGGTAIGEQIRNVLLDPTHEEMSVRCELLMYMASRAQLASQRLNPAKARGSFIFGGSFYQFYASLSG